MRPARWDAFPWPSKLKTLRVLGDSIDSHRPFAFPVSGIPCETARIFFSVLAFAR